MLGSPEQLTQTFRDILSESPPSAPPDMPPGWEAIYSRSHNAWFYKSASGLTTWERPDPGIRFEVLAQDQALSPSASSRDSNVSTLLLETRIPPLPPQPSPPPGHVHSQERRELVRRIRWCHPRCPLPAPRGGTRPQHPSSGEQWGRSRGRGQRGR